MKRALWWGTDWADVIDSARGTARHPVIPQETFKRLCRERIAHMGTQFESTASLGILKQAEIL